MPRLTADQIEEILSFVYSTENEKRIAEDYERYMVYQGRLRETIEEAIKREFIKKSTVQSMITRVIPINLVQKIVNKLAAGLYVVSPLREPETELDSDQESIDAIVKETKLDQKMLHANRLFKLHKHFALEPYTMTDGSLNVRVLASHTYTPYSFDVKDPAIATVFVKHLRFSGERQYHRHLIWTDEDQILVDGKGAIYPIPGNEESINPYGAMPFVFVKESDDMLIPVSDDDLISIQKAICLLLTDLAFASKYQAWSVLYTVGVTTNEIEFNPNSVIQLNRSGTGEDKPEIGMIKPEVDMQGLMDQIAMQISLLLTTKDLSVSSVSVTLEPGNAASGISKIIDAAESNENQASQVATFTTAERKLWMLIKTMMPVWISQGEIKPESVVSFSNDFALSISYQQPEIKIGQKEKVETEKMKVDAGFSSQRMAIKELNPEMTDEQVDQIIAEILKEKAFKMEVMRENGTQTQEPNDQLDQAGQEQFI